MGFLKKYNSIYKDLDLGFDLDCILLDTFLIVCVNDLEKSSKLLLFFSSDSDKSSFFYLSMRLYKRILSSMDFLWIKKQMIKNKLTRLAEMYIIKIT